jgi:hypothetical protein
MHCIVQPPHFTAARSNFTELVRNLVDRHSSPTELEHLRHEWQLFEFTFFVEGGEDRVCA